MDVTIYTHRTGNMSLHFFERPTSAPTVVLLPETDDGRRHPVISPERGGPNSLSLSRNGRPTLTSGAPAPHPLGREPTGCGARSCA